MKILLILIIFISCSSTEKKERTPQDKKADLYFTQGTKELVRGEFPNALKNLRLSAKYRPNDTETQNNLGMAYFYRKSIPNAIKHLKLAIKVDPKNEDAKLNLGSIYMKIKKYELAEEQFKDILKSLVYNHQYKTHYNLALLSEKNKRFDKAIKQLKASIEINEGYCPAHLKLANIYKNQGNYKLALKSYENGTKGVCYSFFIAAKEHVLLLVKIGDFQKASLKLIDLEERFSDLDKQKEIQKLKRYVKIKKQRTL